jgi:hypothetical protein
VNLNRVVAVVSAALALTLAILPVLGNFDWQSSAGLIAGITAVLAITLKWLDGWQAHEGRVAERTVVEVPAKVSPRRKTPR